MNVAEYVEITKRFADFYTKTKDDPDVKDLRKDVQDYQNELDHLHIRDRHVRGEYNFQVAISQLFERLIFLVVLLPLALPGFIINLPIIATGNYMNLLTPYLEFKATLKFMSALFVVPFSYLVMAYIASFFVNLTVLSCFICLSIVGLANVLILEEEAVGIRSIMGSLRLISLIVINGQRHELTKLKVHRNKLEKKVIEMVNKHATPKERTLESISKDAQAPFAILHRKRIPKRLDSYSDIAFI